jgi:hypothetical protein
MLNKNQRNEMKNQLQELRVPKGHNVGHFNNFHNYQRLVGTTVLKKNDLSQIEKKNKRRSEASQ